VATWEEKRVRGEGAAIEKNLLLPKELRPERSHAGGEGLKSERKKKKLRESNLTRIGQKQAK